MKKALDLHLSAKVKCGPVFIARARWSLSQALRQSSDQRDVEYASELRLKAIRWLESEMKVDIQQDQDCTDLFEERLMYWSR